MATFFTGLTLGSIVSLLIGLGFIVSYHLTPHVQATIEMCMLNPDATFRNALDSSNIFTCRQVLHDLATGKVHYYE